ncbi:Pr6Pr family membrane protein [Nocardia sp. NPDC088792]|uniref:Pr6Pr family membrane protein n=1 Tax=Nocardia sp. NPDC088792 TaxID=3364332 RepID=UPI00380AC7D0
MAARGGTPVWIRALRIGFGLMGVVALSWIPLSNLGNAQYSYANYFSYFTIQSNLLAVVVLLVGGLRDPQSRRWQLVRGAGTLYLVITGIIYAVLLAHVDVMLTDRLTNDALHRIQPIVMVADWLLVAAAGIKLTVRVVLGWLIYPLVYGAYTLLRGPLVDWYPYPFIDPRSQGYPSLFGGLALMAFVFAVLAALVAGLNGLVPRAVARA